MLTPSEAMEPVMLKALYIRQDGPEPTRAAVVALVVAELEAMPCTGVTVNGTRTDLVCNPEYPSTEEYELCARCQRLAAWRAM